MTRGRITKQLARELTVPHHEGSIHELFADAHLAAACLNAADADGDARVAVLGSAYFL